MLSFFFFFFLITLKTPRGSPRTPTNAACLSNCPWHGTSQQVHEQQILHIEFGVFGEENDVENRNPAADALCQKRSGYSVEPASSALEH